MALLVQVMERWPGGMCGTPILDRRGVSALQVCKAEVCSQRRSTLAVASGAPDRKPFGWEMGAPQTDCFDDLGLRESVPGGPPEPCVTIQLTIVDVLGCWE